ncbi:hypothetical protein GUJ93_ZPchr0007g5252 [Zizania palustris]|uniref:Uncharacterized protein n=1 Tax=Zizania palustris TaxID=103762 RepID=A0A8J5TC95_ZIZPA|nr:hypothetical protein GUJ93_ZPchr0007g5252 [Zizania palustris]
MASAEPSAADSSQEPAPAVAASVGGPNPCCAKLWKKYQKLETSRTALREAVKLLQSENERLMKERSELNKVCKEERLRGDSAEAARETESDARDRLEKEIIELKEHNSALQQSQNVNKNDEPLRISELEEEIIRLKQVLGEERKKSNSEKKNAEEAKIKSLEMQKLLKMETHKSEECKRLSGTERKAANDLRASCEKLRSEANEAREMLAAQVKKTEEANKMAEEEKQKASKEKKRADSEKKLAEKNKNLIEAERKKVMEEKSRADCLFAKLEEQNKFNADLRVSIEAERKNVMNEKNHMNHLSQKLEEERKRSECLQRKFDDLCDTTSFGKHGQQHVDTVKEAANIKLLKEKLKLKKEQLKHVKNVSKLDEAKNALIRRELQCLKHDWMQLLSRFNMLDDHLGADGIEGIHVLTELKRHPEMHNFEQNLLHRNPVAAPYFGLQAGIGPFSSSTPRDYTSYRIPRESCTRPISGTSSELEPPIGSSARTKSKSQHRSSCPTSISDKKFMGSQGKDRPFVSTSTDIRKKQSSMVPELITKDSNGTKKQDNRALPVVPGDSFQLKALKPSQPGVKEIADKMLRVKKRKRTKVSPKSTTDLSSKHNLLHLEMKTHDATSNGISTFNDRRSCVQQGSSIMPVVTEDDLQNHRRKCHIIADKTPLFTVPTKVPSPAAGNAYAASKFASLLSFEEMIRGGCLKLLKLDNDADEKKYTRAMERPISPDLPVVPPANEPIYDKSHHLSGGTLNSLEYERDCPPSGADSMDLEMRPNLLGVEESAIRKEAQNSHKLGPLFNAIDFRDNVKQLCANDKYNSASNYSCNTKLDDASTKRSLSCLLHEDRPQNIVAFPADVAGNTSIPVFSQSSCSSHQNSTFHFQHFSKEASNENGPNQINGLSSDSGQQNTVRKCKAKAVGLTDVNSDSFIGLHRGNKNPPIHFVGIARMEKSDIIRIFRYWETVVAESREISKEASIDSPLFERISTEPLLRLEEKAALIVSLMLWDIHGFTTSDPVVDGNFASDFSLTRNITDRPFLIFPWPFFLLFVQTNEFKFTLLVVFYWEKLMLYCCSCLFLLYH